VRIKQSSSIMLCDVLQETAEEELDYDADEVMEQAPAPVATQVPLLYHCFSFDCILPGEGRVIQNSLVHSESNGTQCSAWKANATLVLECLLIIDVTALAWHDVAVGDEPVLKEHHAVQADAKQEETSRKRRPADSEGVRSSKAQKTEESERRKREPIAFKPRDKSASGSGQLAEDGQREGSADIRRTGSQTEKRSVFERLHSGAGKVDLSRTLMSRLWL